ncbi:cytochrome P450 [Crucibulum laeve]|uniref:Cytochrome P450 n=1 Tax=Crucibulum laeve TaxID=68775 RepID=A0A5C3LPX8_9AGAR|nr:cytochrome P450 [Crucibulum laeve]
MSPIVIWPLTCTILCLVLFVLYRRMNHLKHIPTIGPEGPVLSNFGAIRFLFDANNMLRRGFSKHQDTIFKVPDLSQWVLAISGTKLVEEFRKVPEDILSSKIATDEILQIQYTLGDRISDNPYHIPIVRSQLTRNLGKLVPELQNEVVVAFNETMPLDSERKEIRVVDSFMQIVCRASNRAFVGLPLCRNQDFVDLNVKFTVDVMTAATILRMLPHFMRPLVAKVLTNVQSRIRHGIKHLRPVIEQRRLHNQSDKKEVESLDMLSWLMSEAQGDELSVDSLTRRILTVNFAAIHTSTMTFAHAVYYLAENQPYMQPLREEIRNIVQLEGWTKEALDKMDKVDSFIRESQRMHALGCLLMYRQAVKDYTFSDGTFIPRGTTLAVAVDASHFEDESYDNANEFKGFRFSDMKSEGDSRKLGMVSAQPEFLAFGYGRHACPGRFFAAVELKLMLAHLVMFYDIKLKNGATRPSDIYIASTRIPNPKGCVLLRQRKND